MGRRHRSRGVRRAGGSRPSSTTCGRTTPRAAPGASCPRRVTCRLLATARARHSGPTDDSGSATASRPRTPASPTPAPTTSRSGAWTDETPAAGDRPVERCLHGCWWTDDGELGLYAGQTTGVTGPRRPLDAGRWLMVGGRWRPAAGAQPVRSGPPRRGNARVRRPVARRRLPGRPVAPAGRRIARRHSRWLGRRPTVARARS